MMAAIVSSLTTAIIVIQVQVDPNNMCVYGSLRLCVEIALPKHWLCCHSPLSVTASDREPVEQAPDQMTAVKANHSSHDQDAALTPCNKVIAKYFFFSL